MLGDFAYTCVGSLDEYGTLENFPVCELGFQTYAYEVCILDMLFMPGAWNNACVASNIIKCKASADATDITELHVTPGNYADNHKFLCIINKTLEEVARIETEGTHCVLLTLKKYT